MMLSQPNLAGIAARPVGQVASVGVSSPMVRKTARDSADKARTTHAALAWAATGENSNDMASAATPVDAGNCAIRYPSQSSWPGYVPTVPAAHRFTSRVATRDARVLADQTPLTANQLRAQAGLAFLHHTSKTQRGNSRCVFSKWRRSPVSPSAALRPVATQRLNKVFWGQAQVQAQPLSPAATPKQQRSLAQAPTCFIAKPIRNAATNLMSVPSRAHQEMMTTKALCGPGGFLLPRSLPGLSHLKDGPRLARKEGTFDVQ